MLRRPDYAVQKRRGIAALYDRCAHRRMPLSHGSVGPEGVTCPYHGCRFSADGTGYCPTTRSNRFKVPVFETRTLHDVVWVRSRDAANAVSHDLAADSGLHPELAEDDHAFACVVAKDIAAPLQLVVDNMTELEHTGAVHKKLAFGIDDFDTVETRCRHDDDGVTIFYEGRQRPFPLYLSLLSGLRRGDVYVQTAGVSFTPPCASYRLWWTAGKGGTTRPFGLRFVNYYTEVDAGRTSLFSFVYWKTEGTLMHALPAPVSARLPRHRLRRTRARQGHHREDAAARSGARVVPAQSLRSPARRDAKTDAASLRVYPGRPSDRLRSGTGRGCYCSLNTITFLNRSRTSRSSLRRERHHSLTGRD